jgi:hypothetical protein
MKCSMRFPIRSLSTLLLSLASLQPQSIVGATITLNPSADTSVMEIAPFNNLGAVQSLAIGVTGTESPARGLLRFDFSSIPPDAVVTSVELSMVVVRQATLVEDSTFDLHRLLVPWGEGDKGEGTLMASGAPATEGEATWAARLHPLTFWGGGGGAAGSDYKAEPSSSAGTSSTIVFESTTDMVADVQSWLSNPSSNFGWLVKDQVEGLAQTARRIGSRENSTVMPRLVVNYTIVPVLRITDIAVDNGRLCFRFQATAGKGYRIERRPLVDSGDWTVIQSIPPVANSGPIESCDMIGTDRAFYRIADQ